MPTLCLILLLAMLSSAELPSVSAQYIDGGTTRDCARTSTQLTVRNGNFGWSFETEYQRSMQSIDSFKRICPHDTVCAQKLTAVEGQMATYSEDCWELSTITEYTEVACNTDLCNNVTFASFPTFSKSYFRQGSPVRCFNHGQLLSMDNFRETIRDRDYKNRFYRDLPYGDWNRGMCGAAIYAMGGRARVMHERVFTGDSQQKFAVLRICSRSGCDRSLVRDVMNRGFGV